MIFKLNPRDCKGLLIGILKRLQTFKVKSFVNSTIFSMAQIYQSTEKEIMATGETKLQTLKSSVNFAEEHNCCIKDGKRARPWTSGGKKGKPRFLPTNTNLKINTDANAKTDANTNTDANTHTDRKTDTAIRIIQSQVVTFRQLFQLQLWWKTSGLCAITFILKKNSWRR